MAKASFDRVMPHVFTHEGGYVDHPSDPGGATNMGITLRTLEDWRGQSVSKSEVRRLGKTEASAIYRAKYWEAIRGDDLPAGVDYAVFDFAINSGPGRAAKYLQNIVGVTADGRIGSETLAATESRAAASVVNDLCDARLHFLKGLNIWPTFGKGWTRRVSEVRKVALELVGFVTPPEPERSVWAKLIDFILTAIKAVFQRR